MRRWTEHECKCAAVNAYRFDVARHPYIPICNLERAQWCDRYGIEDMIEDGVVYGLWSLSEEYPYRIMGDETQRRIDKERAYLKDGKVYETLLLSEDFREDKREFWDYSAIVDGRTPDLF